MTDHTSSPLHPVFPAAVIVAPLLLLASTVAYVANGDGMNDGEAGGIVQLWAFVAFAMAAVALTRAFRQHAPRAADLLLAVALAGMAGGVAYAIDSIQVAVFGTESLQETDSIAASLALQLPGILFPASLVGVGVMLARTGTAPRAAAIGLAVGAVLFPASRIPDVEALAIACDLVLVAAMGAIGFGYARTGASPSMSAKLPL